MSGSADSVDALDSTFWVIRYSSEGLALSIQVVTRVLVILLAVQAVTSTVAAATSDMRNCTAAVPPAATCTWRRMETMPAASTSTV